MEQFDPIQNKEVIFGEKFRDQRAFWIPLPDYVTMRATLLSVGNYSYIYMANESINLLGESNATSLCTELRNEFDKVIYPKAIELAGNLDGRLGDIDGDPKVTVFLAPLVRYLGPDYLGFYLSKDDDPNHLYSNYREMVYVDFEIGIDEIICTTVHEFNHLIWANYERFEAEFLVEGVAEYAVLYSGYNSWITDMLVTSFTYHPEISLLYFNRIHGSPLWSASYGQAFMFVLYLAEKYGDEVIKSLVSTIVDGARGVDVALANASYSVTFNDIYLDWITACVIDDVNCYNGLYGFETVDYTINEYTHIGYTFPIEKSNREHIFYGFEAKKISVPYDNFTFEIDNPYPYALGISIAIKDKNGWHVTQSLHTEESKTIVEYISGEEIDEAYIITSLMSETTPTEFGSIHFIDFPPPSVNLNYTFMEGHIIPTQTAEGYWNFLVFTAVLTFLASLMMIVRRRK